MKEAVQKVFVELCAFLVELGDLIIKSCYTKAHKVDTE